MLHAKNGLKSFIYNMLHLIQQLCNNTFCNTHDINTKTFWIKWLYIEKNFCIFAPKRKKMKRTFFLSLITMLFMGCQQNSLIQQLVEIDSIAFREGSKKAYEMLNDIVPETIVDEECKAYYWLLKIRTELNMSIDIQSVEPLDQSINYYKHTHQKGKLARAYYYKGYILNHQDKLKEAIINLKEAEAIIKDNDKEIALADHIFYTLSHVNYKVKERRLAIEYAKLALKTAYHLKNEQNIASDLMILYVDYKELGNIDSAFYYLNRCIPLLDSIPMNIRYSYYANIGNALTDTDIMKAEDYLNKSVEIKPNVFAFKGLAKIYYKRGERDKAKDMWAKALQTNNLYLKSEVLQAMYESQQEEGDYKSASETAMHIAMLKDSIAKQEKNADIRSLQEQFEKEQQMAIEKSQFKMYISLACVLLLLAIALVVYLYYHNIKSKAKLRETKENLEKYRNQLKRVEAEGKGDSKEVERLTQKISELQTKQNALLQNGRERYEEIMAGGTTLKWSKNDFTDCIEYYRTIDATFVAHLETDYNHLSSKYIFFAIMEHLGKSDEELQRIMAIGQNTIRANRSRINQKKRDVE